MLTLNTLRTKFGAVLTIVIGVALVAFIISLRELQPAGEDPKVGEINGDDINYSEFVNAYEEIKLQMGGEATDYSQSMRMISAAWQSLVSEHIFTPDFQKLGIWVSDEEFQAILDGEIYSNILAQAFGNPQTGAYDPQTFHLFEEQIAGNPQGEQILALIKKQIRFERAMNKYTDLVRGGEYVNTLAVKNSLATSNNIYNGKFVSCKYHTVADSLVSVSEGEMKSYYKEHKAKFEQTPYRAISYAAFEIAPSDEDRQNIENEALAASKDFAKATNLATYSRENRHASVATNFVAAKNLSTDEARALRAGRTYGPTLNGDEWYASRVVEYRDVPEKLNLKHIALNYTDTELADKVLAAAKRGEDFDALAKKHSLTGTSELGEVNYSELAIEFANALRNARKGSIVKVAVGNTIQIFKVVGVGERVRHYRLATLTYPLIASQATKNALHNEANKFAVEAGKEKEKSFDELASATSASLFSTNIEQNSRDVEGFEDARELVRWANEAKVGKVSEVFTIDNSYVVAVVTEINDEEYKAFEDVKTLIKSALIKEKKFDIIKEKMTGATLEEIAKNAGSKVENFNEAKASAYYIRNIGPEPRVAGALAEVGEEQKGKVLPLIKGANGVFAVEVENIAVENDAQTIEAERVKKQAQVEAMAPNRAMYAIQDMAEVVDNSVMYF